jgi:hypothetical protein
MPNQGVRHTQATATNQLQKASEEEAAAAAKAKREGE